MRAKLPLVSLNSELLREADRQMTVCNACRYCEGVCAVFPALERRRVFRLGDLDQLANLCHGCGACFFDCQFASPHPFAVDVPRTLSALRRESWQRHVWPSAVAPLLRRNLLAVAAGVALAVAAFIVGMVALVDRDVLFGVHAGPGAFYRVMPHGAMAACSAQRSSSRSITLALGVRRFWRATGGGTPTRADLAAALRSAATLRNLEGGGAGCMNSDETPDARRRLFHHLAFYGFLACLASTALATLWHYVGGRAAPYPWYDPVVLLGLAGGLGLVVGPIGLWRLRKTRDPGLGDDDPGRMDDVFLATLIGTSVTGLALLACRGTAAMGLLLALHLGIVLAFFLALPYSRFVHGLYRMAALVRDAMELRRADGAAALVDPDDRVAASAAAPAAPHAVAAPAPAAGDPARREALDPGRSRDLG